MNNEKEPKSGVELSPEQRASLESAGEQHVERLREDLERGVEQSPEQSTESARHEALEQASPIEQEQYPNEKEEAPVAPVERSGQITRHEADASFNQTMQQVQAELPVPSRTFSKVIHNKGVERASEVVGSTIARPNAILFGALFAFLVTLVVYLVAKNLGYVLSGFETIGAFVLGWIIGVVFDFFRVMVTGKHS